MTDERLRPQAVALVVKRAALATSAALAGADLKDIMAQTRHRSHDIALRYIRRAEIWKNNVTQLLLARRPSRPLGSNGTEIYGLPSSLLRKLAPRRTPAILRALTN